MGYEYRLQFPHPGPDAVAEAVRKLRFAREREPRSGAFEVWAGEPDDGMPDATLHVEPYGLYYCWYGVAGRELLGTLLAQLTSEFGPVTVAEVD